MNDVEQLYVGSLLGNTTMVDDFIYSSRDTKCTSRIPIDAPRV